MARTPSGAKYCVTALAGTTNLDLGLNQMYWIFRSPPTRTVPPAIEWARPMEMLMMRAVTVQSRAAPIANLLAFALGAAAVGAIAIGAVAISRVAIDRIVIKRARLGR
jgi:hypothetical protein